MIFPIKVLADHGFEILATQGTAEVLRRNGVAGHGRAQALRGPGPERRADHRRADPRRRDRAGRQHAVRRHQRRLARLDGYEIRTAAVRANIPCITTVQGLGAAVQGIEALKRGDIGVRSLQDWARRSRRAPRPRLPDSAVRPRASTPASTPRRRTTSAFRAIRAARPGARAGRSHAGATPVRGDGPDLPERARPGGRLRQERRRHRRAGGARASGTSRSARSPASRSRATRGRGCSGCRTDRAVVNRMGFNNDGAEVGRRAAGAPRGAPRPAGRCSASTSARPRSSPRTTRRGRADYEKSARLLAPYADYLVVNVSSPNTPGLRNLQAVEKLRPLLEHVRRVADEVTATTGVPLLVKIAPDLADEDVLEVADLALALGPGRHHRHQHHDLPRRAARPSPPRSRRSAPAGCPARPLTARAPRPCCGCCAAGSART